MSQLIECLLQCNSSCMLLSSSSYTVSSVARCLCAAHLTSTLSCSCLYSRPHCNNNNNNNNNNSKWMTLYVTYSPKPGSHVTVRKWQSRCSGNTRTLAALLMTALLCSASVFLTRPDSRILELRVCLHYLFGYKGKVPHSYLLWTTDLNNSDINSKLVASISAWQGRTQDLWREGAVIEPKFSDINFAKAVGSGEGLCPLPRKFWTFAFKMMHLVAFWKLLLTMHRTMLLQRF